MIHDLNDILYQSLCFLLGSIKSCGAGPEGLVKKSQKSGLVMIRIRELEYMHNAIQTCYFQKEFQTPSSKPADPSGSASSSSIEESFSIDRANF